MVNILTINAFNDNYIWLIKDSQSPHCIVVDPGDASPVIEMLESQNLILDAIIITHKHYDHIDGIPALLETYGEETKLYSKNKLFPQSITVSEGQSIDFFGGSFSLKVMEVPGHTLDHVAYFNSKLLFCGDTLFSGGCGRLFEGSPAQMYSALTRIAELDDKTNVYCTHEYTQSNLTFAHHIEPKNVDLLNYMQAVAKKRQQGLATLPTTIALEKLINPFLRCEKEDLINPLQNQLAMPLKAGLETFTALRKYKDNF